MLKVFLCQKIGVRCQCQYVRYPHYIKHPIILNTGHHIKHPIILNKIKGRQN